MEKKQLQNLKIRAESSSTTSLGKIGLQQGTGNEACASLAFFDLFGDSK
jgi:hypothetical protein